MNAEVFSGTQFASYALILLALFLPSLFSIFQGKMLLSEGGRESTCVTHAFTSCLSASNTETGMSRRNFRPMLATWVIPLRFRYKFVALVSIMSDPYLSISPYHGEGGSRYLDATLSIWQYWSGCGVPKLP